MYYNKYVMFRRQVKNLLFDFPKIYNNIFIRCLMEIKVYPEEPLVDDKISITISGLSPQQKVTVKTSVTEVKSTFSSSACFISDASGHVFIDKQPSILGTYTGDNKISFTMIHVYYINIGLLARLIVLVLVWKSQDDTSVKI